MKALVVAGGIPQIALIKELKARGVLTIAGRINRNYLLERIAAPKRKEAEGNGSV